MSYVSFGKQNTELCVFRKTKYCRKMSYVSFGKQNTTEKPTPPDDVFIQLTYLRHGAESS
jgi:hypothetical protein